MSSPVLNPLHAAASQAAVEACPDHHPTQDVKHLLLEICEELLTLDIRSSFWPTAPPSPYIASLRTLHERLHAGKLPPSPLHTHAHNESRIHKTMSQRTSKQPSDRPLEDFEDLYYAMLAKIQEIYQLVQLRINNKFTAPTEKLFENGPTFEEAQDRLQECWDTLNALPLVKTLDAAVQKGRINGMHNDILERKERGLITGEDAQELIDDLLASEDEVPGLAWIGGWAPSMIRAWLEEKYRVLMRVEREEQGLEDHVAQKRQGERDKQEKEEYDREERWIREYEEERRKWQEDNTRTTFEVEAERVQEYGRRLRERVGGDALGLRNETWTRYGNV